MTVPDALYVPGAGRRAAARRRRRQRRRLILALTVALALLVAAVVVVLVVRGGSDSPDVVEPQGRTQQTLLMQVRGADGTALASALLAHDPPSETGSVVLVPPQVIVDLPGAGSLPFGQALTSGQPNGPRDALADLLGVTVDATWVLDAGALAALIDGVGGITASVDVPVVQDGIVVVPQGEQKLDGARALALLGYLATGEQEQARLARQQQVIDGLLRALPDDAPAVTVLLTGLGAGSMVSVPVTALTDLLLGLKADAEQQQLQYDSLPVIPIDPGGGVTAFRLNEEAARALVDRALAQSVPAGERETGNRVLVLNGVGRGIGEAARTKLVDADFVFVGARNAENFEYATTQILVPEATPEAQMLGERVAAALGVPPDVRQADLGTIADVVVIIGADFQA